MSFSFILQHTPLWVWLMLLAMLFVVTGFGALMAFPRQRTIRSAIVVPAVMIVLSFSGVVSAFGIHAADLTGWLAGLALAMKLSDVAGFWKGVTWSESDRRLSVPGSWIPMGLNLGIFFTKFAAGILLAMRHDFATDALFGAMVGFVYGAFSGAFLSRAMVMWRIAARSLKVDMPRNLKGSLGS